MSHAYYYFAASLPMLAFDSKLPMSGEAFLQDCERLLPEEDYFSIRELLSQHILEPAAIGELLADSEGHIRHGNVMFLKIIEFFRSFRNQLAYYRAQKASRDPQQYLRGDFYPDPFISDVIQQADKAKNPLEAEKILDRAIWKFLDDLQGGHFFDLEFIIVYGLKLKILERYQHIQSRHGREKFAEVKKINLSTIQPQVQAR